MPYVLSLDEKALSVFILLGLHETLETVEKLFLITAYWTNRMINAGGSEIVIRENGWTAATKDGKLSAHFEHTVALTEKGPEILSAL